ncbi:hypothetical protein CNMCM6936_004387 [Aspergillus lentulus]|uniref:Major facilitator superfamily (MFS) profile domain-containing protein n=1 Tax=Aspergillus lentulus TaxID=293939 RepID=A0AAN6BNL2_ASPLE|nr:hypothetical protein CNMCM6069_008198 [Aspergillus lentulus]KAF4167755.1 hypothetical protein CNMCM6936_004387 [Aspergillus lentulus]KAF4182702.1 hypothetical protein CNMCM8060_006066 [Aspergillus lentulus]KAF4187778.1 hypothetical protein CNMCM7927_003267 [Aspergillus lentulus]KAF4195845.1 hypothetical protein CNMCM8694_005717 [Aspergillus lentulus]
MASAKTSPESLQAIPITVTVSQHRHQNVAKEGHEGVDAWLQALGAFLIYTATWGLLSAYGSYESFYETTLLSSTPSTTISWVGTLQGVILISREYYQILLAQGVCVGIGSAILYVPSISLVASRFQQRRPLAMFIATTGTAFGGIIYPIIFSSLQPKLGFPWATRVLGFVTLGELIIAMAIILPNTKSKAPHNVRSLLDPTAFRDPAFMAFCVALFLMWIAYWVPFFLLPTFAQFKAGASSNLAFYVLVICNASTIPGRYLAVPLANRLGPALTMGGFALASSVLLFGWIGVKSVGSTVVWAVLIALFMGPLAVLYPIIVPHLSPEKDFVGTRMGISSAAAALGTLVGFPVTSALNDIEMETRQTTSDDAFPTTQLFLLAICRVAEPIALTSIFPYSWVMVKDFRVADRTDASFYAGILVSAFSLAEALTGMFWGGLSDRIGRKPVLLSGCFGTILSLLLVGFAPNFWVALLGRALGGLLNGNIGVIQTMVGELVKRPEHEPRAYAVMPFVWSIGTIIGPAIGGLLAKPADSYPSLFSANGLFGKFPYLLPNLVCSLLLLLSIIGSWLFLQETHPGLQHQNGSGNHDHTSAESPLLATAGATANAGVDLRAESYGTFNQVRLQADEDWFVNADGSKFKTQKQPVFTYRVVSLIIALSIFTYHSMTYDHLLPIFLQDKNGRNVSGLSNAPLSFPGGLGLSTRTVGLIMSSDGIIALVIQSCIFPILAQLLGVWKLFVVVTVLHPIAYFIVPFLMFLPQSSVIFGIYICLIVRNILSIIDYPVLLILIKQASPSESVMGKINGLAASAGAVARTIAPPIAGFLYSTGADMNFTAIAWWGSSLVAVMGAVQLCFMKHKKHTSATIRPAMPCHYHYVPDESQPQKETIHIIVTDTDANADGAGTSQSRRYSFLT